MNASCSMIAVARRCEVIKGLCQRALVLTGIQRCLTAVGQGLHPSGRGSLADLGRSHEAGCKTTVVTR